MASMFAGVQPSKTSASFSTKSLQIQEVDNPTSNRKKTVEYSPSWLALHDSVPRAESGAKAAASRGRESSLGAGPAIETPWPRDMGAPSESLFFFILKFEECRKPEEGQLGALFSGPCVVCRLAADSIDLPA